MRDSDPKPNEAAGPPETAPLPAPKPQVASSALDPARSEAAAKPADADAPAGGERSGKPDDEKSADGPQQQAALEPRKGPSPQDLNPFRKAADPAEEASCREELRKLGVTFREHERLADAEAGCLIEHPIVISDLGSGVKVEPPATVGCAIALATAHFMADHAGPEAGKAFGAAIVGIDQASAYVCRPRHGQTKMSEHAFGNAIDIARFELSDGRKVDVQAYGPGHDAERDFLRSLRAAACGPYKTVLGPGTDADHATHLHLDLQPRRRGGSYCK